MKTLQDEIANLEEEEQAKESDREEGEFEEVKV